MVKEFQQLLRIVKLATRHIYEGKEKLVFRDICT